jgi:hypothetical protein
MLCLMHAKDLVTHLSPHWHLQDFYNVVFDNKDTLQDYHRLEGDPDASISPWSGNTRVISFSVPLSGVPDVVKRAIGMKSCVHFAMETHHLQFPPPASLSSPAGSPL